MTSLKDLRKGRDLTLAELSKLSGVRLETLSRLESGKNKPRQSTINNIANALRIDPEIVEMAISSTPDIVHNPFRSWKFLQGLDLDLKKGLLQQLICSWTHHSTGLEGNTISEGDTHLILTEGLTISGKSLREHQEVHGHGSALKTMSSWITESQDITISKLHDLHRLIQTEMVFDIYAPVGKFKVEKNGTTVIRKNQPSVWHEYALPMDIPFLMDKWLENFKHLTHLVSDEKSALDIYTRIHLGYVSIHPYADGNGRMARILANFPLLKNGFPPIIIHKEYRKEYLLALGDYCTKYPSPNRHNHELYESDELDQIKYFFKNQWLSTQTVIREFRERQIEREENFKLRTDKKDQ
jgi:Fic family protein/DNA-binding XRE family transcriptional regulator